MRPSSIYRSALTVIALLGSFTLAASVMAQDVGVDVGGGAGGFRPKNPETKRRPRTPPVGGANRVPRPTAAPSEERIEDLLEKGNEFRDARRFAEAEEVGRGSCRE